MNVTSNTQVNQLTLGRFKETADAVREAGAIVWRIQLTVPMGRAADRPEWLLQPWQMVDAINELAAIKTEILTEAYHAGIAPNRVMNVTMGNNIGYYGPHEHLLRSTPGVSAKAWYGCQAGNLHWVLSPMARSKVVLHFQQHLTCRRKCSRCDNRRFVEQR